MARPTSSGSSEATIAEGTQVRGRISGDGALAVQGRVEGDVTLRGELHVGSTGRLVSTVDATSITIEGEVEGNVRAQGGGVVVSRGGRLVGDVQAGTFQLDEGADFAGNLAHDFDLPTELGGVLKSSPAQRRR